MRKLVALHVWVTTRQNLSSGIPTKRDSNRSLKLQRLARKLNFTCSKFIPATFCNVNNKGADQAVRMRRLVCAFVVRKPLMTGFLASRPI